MEVLEQIKKHTDMVCNAFMMRGAYHAGNWESCKTSVVVQSGSTCDICFARRQSGKK